MKHKPIVNKKKRASALARRLKEGLGLDECVPLLTVDEARERGVAIRDHQVAFALERDGMSIGVPIARAALFAPAGAYEREEWEPYLAHKIAEAWQDYLKGKLADALFVMGSGGLSDGR